MTRWLVDTNVVSELRKRNCDPGVKRWAAAQANDDLFISRITVAEVRYGIERAPDEHFRAELTRWLDDVLLPWFDNRILDVTEPVILEWRRMVERGKAMRHTFAQPDLFLAATAVVHGLGVATRNIDDFEKADVSLLNPWQRS